MSWTISGCLHCPWTAHAQEPIANCPNDGSQTVMLPDYVSQWKTLEAARYLFKADGFERAERQARASATAELQAACDVLSAALSGSSMKKRLTGRPTEGWMAPLDEQ